MQRKRKNEISAIVRRAEAEGLSYGAYVAREYISHTQRCPLLIDDSKPRGITTIQAAIAIDCPRLYKQKFPEKPKAIQPKIELKEKNPFGKVQDSEIPDEAARLYKLGYSITVIAHKLKTTRYDITERLRKAEVEIRSGKRGGLPVEKMLKIRTLHAQGVTLRQIAIECDTVESTVRKYLDKEREANE